MKQPLKNLFAPKEEKDEEQRKQEFQKQALEYFKTRRSIRKFLPQKLEWKTMHDIIDAALNMPCAGNIENVSVIYIDKKETIQKIASLCAKQFWIAEAPALLIVVRDDHHICDLYPKEGKTYSMQSSAAAIENLLMLIHMHDLGSCWIEAFNNQVLKTELKIPLQSQIDAILPVGYPNESPEVPKTPLNSKLFFDKYENKERK